MFQRALINFDKTCLPAKNGYKNSIIIMYSCA